MALGFQTTTGVFVRTPVQRVFIIFSYAVLVNRRGGGRYGRAARQRQNSGSLADLEGWRGAGCAQTASAAAPSRPTARVRLPAPS